MKRTAWTKELKRKRIIRGGREVKRRIKKGKNKERKRKCVKDSERKEVMKI